MTANQLRRQFIDFFVKNGHKEIPSAPLLPINDPSTLFTSSGMQPLVPYLLGQKHPLGKRLVNSQICFRAEDIDQVGDSHHTTFFEMLGNWSLGDYFKKQQLNWFFEFLTGVVGLDKDRLFVSVFDGDETHKVFFNNKYQPLTPDVESIAIWKEIFKTKEQKEGRRGFDPKIKIYTYEADKNWWSRSGEPKDMPRGEIGGPDSEVFYDFGEEIHQKSPFKNEKCHLNCECSRFSEIGNSVFIEYKKTKEGVFEKLPQRNVDFGGGLERILAAQQNQADIFQTELFWPIIAAIEKASGQPYAGHEEPVRVIADHLKAATFMIAQDLEPSNKLAGYILRRLLRRAAVKMHFLKSGQIKDEDFQVISHQVLKIYQGVYFENSQEIFTKIRPIVSSEINRFSQTLNRGLKEIAKTDPQKINGQFAFDLFQSYGFPFEITQELLSQKGVVLDKKEFDQALAKHQQLSRTAAKGLFKGGLADQSEAVIKLHTATHLLHAALRKILGDHVQQVGSNITAQRLRFDFTHPQALTNKEIQQVENQVNQWIKENLTVEMKILSLDEAKKEGALAFFGQRYPEKVKVYSIKGVSQEVCAGPHVDFTGSLGRFMIFKEESAGAAKRRIYARLV